MNTATRRTNPPVNRFKRSLVLLLVGVYPWLGACSQTPNNAGLSHYMLPPDFALLLHVDGERATNNPLRQTAQYLVEPNRAFHAAVGGNIAADFYPQPIKTISREEYYDLAGHALANQLMAEPTSPRSQFVDARVVYTVELRSHGLLHRYTTTPEESPPTVQLLKRLVSLLPRGYQPHPSQAVPASNPTPKN